MTCLHMVELFFINTLTQHTYCREATLLKIYNCIKHRKKQTFIILLTLNNLKYNLNDVNNIFILQHEFLPSLLLVLLIQKINQCKSKLIKQKQDYSFCRLELIDSEKA